MVNKIGLGTVQFGLDYGISNKQGLTPDYKVSAILDYARKAGIDILDTAFAYGKSESVLGRNNLSDFKVVTKFTTASVEWPINHQIETSLNRLGLKHVYAIMAHRPAEIIANVDIWGYLKHLKEQQVVSKIGFSFNDPTEALEIIERQIFPDIIQAPFNYFDNRFVSIMKKLKEYGCEIHSRSSFLQGLFFIQAHELSDNFNEIKPMLTNLQKSIDNLSASLLNYCIEQPFIDKVIIGVNNLDQLKENIESVPLSHSLVDHQLNISDSILNPSKWPKL